MGNPPGRACDDSSLLLSHLQLYIMFDIVVEGYCHLLCQHVMSAWNLVVPMILWSDLIVNVLATFFSGWQDASGWSHICLTHFCQSTVMGHNIEFRVFG